MESPAEEDVVFTDDLAVVSDAVEKKETDEKKEAQMEAMVEEDDEEPKDGKRETLAASSVARKTKRLVRGREKREYAVAKPFRRAVIIIYKKILSMVRQVFKMVASLHGLGDSDLPSDHVVRDMIDKTKVWLVDQMGKHFPSKRSNYLLKRWRTLEPSLQRLIGGGLASRPQALSVGDGSLVSSSVPASSLPPSLPEESPSVDVSLPISSSSSV
jgi:hypothetical protein